MPRSKNLISRSTYGRINYEAREHPCEYKVSKKSCRANFRPITSRPAALHHGNKKKSKSRWQKKKKSPRRFILMSTCNLLSEKTSMEGKTTIFTRYYSYSRIQTALLASSMIFPCYLVANNVPNDTGHFVALFTGKVRGRN